MVWVFELFQFTEIEKAKIRCLYNLIYLLLLIIIFQFLDHYLLHNYLNFDKSQNHR